MEKEKIKVSIIVPVYNVENYLANCLDSLISQTLDSYEIIVVNDGSPDNSQSIIDDYVKKYPDKVKGFIKKNGGVSDARNYGVEKATGEYIGFVDSDDYVREDMYELLYNKAKKENSDVVVCNYYKYSETSVKKIDVIQNINIFNHKVVDNPNLLFECKPYVWNKLYNRKWYVENNFKFPLKQWFEDSAVIYNIMYQANNISAVDDYLYYYKADRVGSITNSVDKRVFDVFKSVENIMEFYLNNVTNVEVLKRIERLCQIHIFVRFKELLKSNNKIMTIKFYNRMLKFYKKYIPDWKNNYYYKKINKKGLYLKIRHIPLLMYMYILIPKTFRKIARRLIKRRKKSRVKSNYMNNERLRELQLIELDILKEIDRVCKEHDIKYYLGEGTLLGAVRHGGFIPWDDDLDIVMPRSDYEKFLKIAQSSLNKEYALLNEEVDSSYYLPFSKVVSLNNFGYINKLDKYAEKYNGPYVDVFPLDYYDSKDSEVVEKKYKKIRKIRDMLLLKANYITNLSFKRKIYNIEAKFYSNATLHKMLKKELISCNKNSKYLCNFASSYHPSRQIVSKEVYGDAKYIEFEGMKFPVPNDYDTLLTTIYGEYKKLPSVNKRKCKHGFYDEISSSTMATTKVIEDQEMEKLALEEIRKLQLYELGILKEIDRVCKKNNIRYYLGEGTLLGAARHGGFIPWDDDLDLVMPRDDFNKFLKICDKELQSNYKLQYYHNIKNYWVQSPKVRLLDKTEFSQSELLKYTKDVGPYVDIFPLDYAPSDFSKLEKQDRYIKRYRRILFLKTGFSKRKKLKYKFLKLYSKFISVEKIHEKINKMAIKYNNDDRCYLCNFGSYYSIRQEVFPEFVYGEPKYIKFEDGEYPVPSNYEYVLTTIYGQYMVLPPKSKQKGKHSFD